MGLQDASLGCLCLQKIYSILRTTHVMSSACGGKMKIIAALAEPLAIRTYLDGVGLASRAPPIAPPRPLPQTQFDYAS